MSIVKFIKRLAEGNVYILERFHAAVSRPEPARDLPASAQGRFVKGEGYIPKGFHAVARRRCGENEREYSSYMIEGESTMQQSHSVKGKGYKQWLWFVALWFAGLATVVIATYPIKWLILRLAAG